MKKLITILSCVIAIQLTFGQMSGVAVKIPADQYQEENDSLVWHAAVRFCNLFDLGDTSSMQKFLPEDFLLQWMHESFIGKRSLINAMKDAATRMAMAYNIKRDNSTMIRYSDDQSAASMNSVFEFIDPANCKSVGEQHGCGLCIFYLKREREEWTIKTIHVDVHCSLCGF